MAGRLLRELTIRQLRALTAVQKHRSVTAAAKQLHLTQPAVTLQLRNLQELARSESTVDFHAIIKDDQRGVRILFARGSSQFNPIF